MEVLEGEAVACDNHSEFLVGIGVPVLQMVLGVLPKLFQELPWHDADDDDSLTLQRAVDEREKGDLVILTVDAAFPAVALNAHSDPWFFLKSSHWLF